MSSAHSGTVEPHGDLRRQGLQRLGASVWGLWQSGSDGRCHRHQRVARHKSRSRLRCSPMGFANQSREKHSVQASGPSGSHFGKLVILHASLYPAGALWESIALGVSLQDRWRISADRGADSVTKALRPSDARLIRPKSSRIMGRGQRRMFESETDASYCTIKQR